MNLHIKTETAVGLFTLVAITAFLYISFKIGYFRFDKPSYIPYKVYFNDAGGLTKKSDVKIAGIKVGWVDSIDLSDDSKNVVATLLISKKYNLPSDSKVIIKQDGLLGFKFADIIVGNSTCKSEKQEETLQQETSNSSIEDLIISLNKLAKDIQSSSEKVKELIISNEKNISHIIQDFHQITSELKQQLPNVSDQLKDSINKLNQDFLPTLTKNLNSVSNTIVSFNQDFLPKINNNFEKVANTIAETCSKDFKLTAQSVQKTSNEIHNIVQKINHGNGLISQLINDNSQSSDEKKNFNLRTFKTINYCVKRLNEFSLGLDNYYEFGFNSKSKKFNEFKTHLNAWLNFTPNFFLVAGTTFSKYKDCYFPSKHLSLNLQFGAYYKNLALRAGFFESTPGVALDFLMPFSSYNFKWVSTFTAYDLASRFKTHFKDAKHTYSTTKLNPHLTWTNRLFYTPNFYFSFGLDDFANKNRMNGFLGFGLTFGDTYFGHFIKPNKQKLNN